MANVTQILILDDEKQRHESIKKFVISNNFFDGDIEFHHAYSEKQFRYMVEKYPLSMIFLDNDLGKDNGSGINCAKFLKKNFTNRNCSIIIHSMNPIAAERIGSELSNFSDVIILKYFLILNSLQT